VTMVQSVRTTPPLSCRSSPYCRTMPDLELYELEGCPYCAKVKTKLDELGLEYESHMVPRSHSERTEVEAVSGQTGVPVLVDNSNGIEGMPESDDIVEYLETQYA
jgi:glutaredoxin 3